MLDLKVIMFCFVSAHQMLLFYGADPNIRVVGDVATNAILRPPLAELLASNEHVTPQELHLLLRYGARVSEDKAQVL